MNIIVSIKQVPETNAVKMDEITGTMIRDDVEAIINPLDLYAIEIAIELREHHGGEITAISMGPSKAESALREAIAMGCDRGILISDKAFSGSDTWSTSYVLSKSIKQIKNFDLILCGERATDGDTGQVGPGIASFLNLPIVTYVSKIKQVTNQNIIAHRLVEEGYEVLEVQLPAVLTVVKEIAIPRLPTLRGKQKARKAEISLVNTTNLAFSEDKIGLNGSPTRVVKIFRPKVTRKCEKYVAMDNEAIDGAVDKLIQFLKKKGLVDQKRSDS